MSEPEKTLTDGSPVPADDSHKTLKPNGQQRGYVVLSGAERAKGFVRPVRHRYRHVGMPAPANLYDLLTEEERKLGRQYGYVKFQRYPVEVSRGAGRYWTQAELDRIGKGCGTVTEMGNALAETYARDPQFYGGTFCCGCRKHFPVGADGEFVWEGTDERVGT